MHLNHELQDSFTLKEQVQCGDLLFVTMLRKTYIAIFLKTVYYKKAFNDEIIIFDGRKHVYFWDEIVSGKIISKFADALSV